jgi:hypothetical protein
MLPMKGSEASADGVGDHPAGASGPGHRLHFQGAVDFQAAEALQVDLGQGFLTGHSLSGAGHEHAANARAIEQDHSPHWSPNSLGLKGKGPAFSATIEGLASQGDLLVIPEPAVKEGGGGIFLERKEQCQKSQEAKEEIFQEFLRDVFRRVFFPSSKP